nr:hypothetical protein [Mucilaginibacter sp. SP1R1]
MLSDSEESIYELALAFRSFAIAQDDKRILVTSASMLSAYPHANQKFPLQGVRAPNAVL